MTKKIKFSIIIPLKELNVYLEESVREIFKMDYDNFEVIVLPNELPKALPGYLKNKKISIIASGKVSPAIKRDIGAEKSRGEYLAFIDDDAYPREDWLSVAEKLFNERRGEALAGAAITPKEDSASQRASGMVFETLTGGAGLSYRYKPAKSCFYVDDFPSVNLIVEKKAFLETGGFSTEFWPGEDTKFCSDFVKKGFKIFYSNKLVVYHHRRAGILNHMKQVNNYSRHRGYFAKKFPDTSFRLTYFIPSLFLLVNIFLLIASFFSMMIFYLWIILLTIYFAILFLDVFSRAPEIKVGLMTILLIFLTHLSYGAGFIKGIASKEFRSELR